VFHELARRRESKIEEGHLMSDHVHTLISIPPKYSVAEVIGFIKGKSSISRAFRNLVPGPRAGGLLLLGEQLADGHPKLRPSFQERGDSYPRPGE
jgi:REP element-mobilizing transposase RayT